MKPKTRFRRLDGILLLDKPSGMSSNQALQRVRHLFRAEKAGHTGSLDPLATGLLPVCFGEATKIAGLLLGARKAYATVAVLGTETDTDDADGTVLRERPVPTIDDATLDAALAAFRGRIRQRAPIYSALKQGGEPLYAMARRGEAVNAPERDVEVLEFRCTERHGDRLSLHVECGSGTYVRSLVRDLGEALGCGAHVAVLRRLWVEPFATPCMHTLETLQGLAAEGDAALESGLLPIDVGLAHFPSVGLDSAAARRFGHGQTVESAAPTGERNATAASSAASHGVDDLVVVRDGTRILGLATWTDGRLRPQRLFSWAADGAA